MTTMTVTKKQGRGKVVPVLAMKAYRRNISTAAIIPILGTRWK
jgi:hypothetical protein